MSDYISREAVEKLLRYCVALEERDSKQTKAEDILRDFYQIPVADVVERKKYNRLIENSLIVSAALQEYQKSDVVEVVHGSDISRAVSGHCEFKCSLCGADALVVEGGKLDGGKFNYCPNCGADMRGEQDG